MNESEWGKWKVGMGGGFESSNYYQVHDSISSLIEISQWDLEKDSAQSPPISCAGGIGKGLPIGNPHRSLSFYENPARLWENVVLKWNAAGKKISTKRSGTIFIGRPPPKEKGFHRSVQIFFY